MTKGIGNKRYTPEFKKIVVETMREEGLSYKETRLRFEIAGEDRVRNWERIYLEEEPEGLAVERRGQDRHQGYQRGIRQARVRLQGR